ncbi:hypothetical protein F2Q69_00054241 [Brassica cretica]|uniref:Uncharacterized protein n=1 Tax=Brassica cretica TaxID=69181 RepID=A0A8S9N131_BRACR|nr:hypothetical protein F2Q69_00054241 [Brassica cretica]
MLLGGTISLHSSGFPKVIRSTLNPQTQYHSHHRKLRRGETACSTQSYETWWLMERLIEDLQMKGICNIALCSDPRILGLPGWDPRNGVHT